MNDLISRQVAIDELDKGAWGVEWDKALAKAMIESLPSAQPEPCEDMYGYIAIETLLNFCENSKDHAVTPNDFMRMARVCMPEPCEDAVSRKKAFEYFTQLWGIIGTIMDRNEWEDVCKATANELPSVTPKQPEQKTGHWILDRSGAYCCSECMEPCAEYVMMKPRDKFCKMCGSRNEVTL